jgi:hypothetical protein
MPPNVKDPTPFHNRAVRDMIGDLQDGTNRAEDRLGLETLKFNLLDQLHQDKTPASDWSGAPTPTKSRRDSH